MAIGAIDAPGVVQQSSQVKEAAVFFAQAVPRRQQVE
jgi:hypothetical protein